MARKKTKDSGIIVRKNRVGLAPISPYDQEQMESLKEGAEFDLVPRSKKSLQQERMYWAILTRAVEATGVRPTKDYLHDHLRIVTGHYKIRVAGNGTVTRVPDSTVPMEAEEYQLYFTAAMAALTELVGYDPIEEMKEERRAA